jgi:tetratricopeptide (TPR) repeat protein
VAILLVAVLVACGGPEEKKLKFYNKGKALYEKGDYVKAKLEFKNAIQIDLKYADAYYMMGMIALKEQNYRGAYGNFLKVVQLSPQHWDAHVQLGNILLAAGRVDDAMEKAVLVLKVNAKNEDALLLKGATLLVKKDIPGACRFLEDVVGTSVKKPDGYLILASAYVKAGEEQKAEEILQKGLAAHEKSVIIRLALVDYHLKNKQTDEAIKLMQQIIEIDPNIYQHRLALAGIYWNADKEQQAVDILKALVSADPKKEERWAEVANFYIKRNKFADAERELKEGIRQNEKTFRIRFVLSNLYVNTNRPDQAISMLKECLKLDNDQANANIIYTKNTLAKIYLARQDMDKAKSYVDEVIEESPKNADAQYTKGTIHLMKGEGGPAVSAFRVVVGENPQFIKGYVSLAYAHALNKEMNLAFDTIKNALKSAPGARDLLRAMARLYIVQKDFKNAEAQYRKVLDANANDLEVRAELGDLLQAAGDYRRAEAEYADIKRRAPEIPLGYLKLSNFYMGQQKAGMAIAQLDQILKIYPDMWSAANDLAFLLAEYGRGKTDLDRALAWVQKAQSLNPGNPYILDTVGWVFYKRGELNKAMEWLGKAQVKMPRHPAINYHLGMVYYQAGNTAKAKEFLQLAIASKGGFAEKDKAQKTLSEIR